jgi:hypothetical protein
MGLAVAPIVSENRLKFYEGDLGCTLLNRAEQGSTGGDGGGCFEY